MTLQADLSSEAIDRSAAGLAGAQTAALFERVTELLMHVDAMSCTAEPTSGDDEGLMLVAATILSTQFHLLNRLSLSTADRRRGVEAMDDHAERLGAQVEGLSIGALGAMSMLLEHVVCDDAAAAGSTLAAALDLFDIEELFDASAVLMASIIHVVAERLALDTMTVHAEMRDGVDVSAQQRTSQTVDSCSVAQRSLATTADVRPLRQTWSGRNSQCHGSRGTDSTQPNRGPFVLSH